ncbi:hypothetical protein CK203_026403 [Vitis vinifera]|uniref:DUF4218 domain-containing protein n=1 Tax=Vitis vinifera TaxID=29760 RepID=A0A438IVH9_VITVI|nr:hypothetical protein CK203_026403 [Vitis vinifera]
MFYIHDLGAPESWEVADLDESMSRLMLSSSSSKKDSSFSSFLNTSVPASAFASALALSSSLVLVGSGMISEDSINQMDQFLREALQNPREQLSSELPRSRLDHHETFTVNDDVDDDDEMIELLSDVCGPIPNRDATSKATNVETKHFDELLGEARKKLFTGSKFSSLTFIVKLMHLKVLNHWSNKSFDMLLELLSEIFPEGTNLPSCTYDAKKMLRDLGLGYEKIHACKFDCALFWKENEFLDKCPICDEDRYKINDGKGKKIPHKSLRFFPLKPRLQRLFMSRHTTSDMRWHKEKRVDDGVLRHPADAEAWKSFDRMYPSFSSESRNVRLGLSSDGFNPFGNMSHSYSMWPIILVPYNLPPWKCMKEPFLMMSLLIPGPHSPGKEIDVYLRPLINELKELWHDGIETYDVSIGQYFKMHAAILWTINDFPAYGMLSGWSTKGYMACPVCNVDTSSQSLRSKICYMGHRHYIQTKHPWRKSRLHDGKLEMNPAPQSFSGDDILQQLENVDHVILGKTKDTYKARLDLQDMKIRKELHLVLHGNKYLKPHACYTLTSMERREFCAFLKSIKFPDGYAANISKRVNGKILGLKSHDCHVLLQRLLPIGIRKFLRKDISTTLIELSCFFQKLCAKSLRIQDLEILEHDIVLILCKLERIFPPAFFDVMVHLLVHLPHEAKLAGLVGLRWMYPIERILSTYKSYVRNKAYPEGSIAEAYIVNESLTFCSQYLLGIETKFNRPDRNVDDLNDQSNGFSVFSQRDCPFGSYQQLEFSRAEIEKAHCVLTKVCTTSEHMEQLEKETNDNLFQRQKQLFPKWFANHMKILRHQGSPEATDELYSLASGPDRRVSLYHSCVVNGIRFHTKDRDDRHTTQNSGVLVLGDHYEDMIDFYGVLLNVVVLDYIFNNQVVLFKCEWFDTDPNKKRLQDDGVLRCINVDNKWYEEDPYVLASQAQQIFYVNDPKLGSSWKVVQKVLHRHIFDVPEQTTTNDSENDNEDPTIEEAYQENDSTDIVWSVNQDCNVIQYQRPDGDPSYIDIENVVDHGRRFENDDLTAFINDQDEEDETLVDYCSEDNENSDEEDHDSDSDSDSDS